MITKDNHIRKVETSAQVLVLWDSKEAPPGSYECVYCWSGYMEDGRTSSLLRYAETHGEQLRTKYLAWIHELGETRIDGKRIIDHLALEDNLSYWWMTRFVEKSHYKSPITDAIRLLALEEIVIQKKPRKFFLVSNNRRLHETVRGLCQHLGIDYKWKKLAAERRHVMRVRDIFRILPQPVQALVSFARYVWMRRLLMYVSKPSWFDGERSLFFCSYFFNIDSGQAEKGLFYSRFWERLHQLVQDMGRRSNWLQLYIPHDDVPNVAIATERVQRFNQASLKGEVHALLDSYLSWGVILRVLKRWFWLNRLSWRLQAVKHAFRPQNSNFSLWPFMREDWDASMRGSVAISNLLWIELFDLAMHDIPHQRKGLYLCENQSWERALIHAWRKHGHGELIAVPHGAVRFWHLSYYSDSRTIQSSDIYPMPQADLVALNGMSAINAYLGVNYPKEAIVECEALRYGHLNGFGARMIKKRDKQEINMLILGDYLPSSTIKTLQLLESAADEISVLVTYTLKPHPNFMVKAEDYPSLHLKIIMNPLGEILHDFDVVYSSNMTSAALEAYLTGLPVVVMLDEEELNFSPLRGHAGVCFVSTSEELANALMLTTKWEEATPDQSDFFFLDNELPRWQKILGPASVA